MSDTLIEKSEPVDWMKKIRLELHYPECWDTMAYPTLWHAIYEQVSCGVCNPRKSPQQREITDEEQLGLLAEDILKMLADHVHNCQTPLRTKLCLLMRPYLKLDVYSELRVNGMSALDIIKMQRMFETCSGEANYPKWWQAVFDAGVKQATDAMTRELEALSKLKREYSNKPNKNKECPNCGSLAIPSVTKEYNNMYRARCICGAMDAEVYPNIKEARNAWGVYRKREAVDPMRGMPPRGSLSSTDTTWTCPDCCKNPCTCQFMNSNSIEDGESNAQGN